MDVYPSPVVARNKGGGNVSIPSRNGAMITAVKNHRHVVAVDDDDDDASDQIECTGKSCKSCTVGVVADCVALCCCPCAVISILGLAFFKIPWIMGKKILVKGKKKSSKKLEKKKKKKKEMEKSYSYRDCVTYELDSIDGISRRIKVFEDEEEEEAEKERTKWGIVIGEEEELKDKFSGRFIDAEEVWFELYEFGHLGFGRVSFTGISPSSANRS
ncbi:uncharacterized protein LOC107813005 [Nicotiana tabacum]|uniref:Transmembrane protein n=1 Tax=Nicotiana tabacum TaxID=4097 RepID=A0A1S4BXR3_TOBAC|nr:uncharacterized protein LOC104110834 isoform X1 [Nicotiana tomentosiformis]XP_009618688.1 uncharacterized protein LOC104110834 isoform X1 [Nicotiana tomentosiformis]XP_016493690.1 PREDICTED: uncharacterized protein LOC107813005 [Nicotiana tabacum]XP_016493691.1 PREDICTED: uncharacterized protein LOC107813005 [Nicotiana tabacum]XP_018631353.1 uncharacterized protein LOC104110834 isoform X1 [Nicotiana tomentosiformis]XP_033515771.1 uncharacterized protein LOC104110834 isoform X1 [Nicotiana to